MSSLTAGVCMYCKKKSDQNAFQVSDKEASERLRLKEATERARLGIKTPTSNANNPNNGANGNGGSSSSHGSQSKGGKSSRDHSVPLFFGGLHCFW